MPKPRKGDRLVYTGPYAAGVTNFYSPGEVVAFRSNRTKVTVLLDDKHIDGTDLFADWDIDETAPAPLNT